MTIVAVASNVALFAFTALVLATDGAPTAPVYIALTLSLLLIPVLNILLILRQSRSRSATRRALAVSNLGLIAFVCWAIVDQYPHPEEEGLVAFIAVTLLVPLLSSIVLLRNAPPSEAAAA